MGRGKFFGKGTPAELPLPGQLFVNLAKPALRFEWDRFAPCLPLLREPLQLRARLLHQRRRRQ
jgi:hypothetical protein